MIRPRVELEGAEKVVRVFRNLGPKLKAQINREVVRSALTIQGNAKRRCPVDTGRLRNSISAADTEAMLQGADGAARLSAETMEAVVGTTVQYAPFVEFGTRRMAAQPFLFPPFEDEAQAFARRLAEVLRGEVGV